MGGLLVRSFFITLTKHSPVREAKKSEEKPGESFITGFVYGKVQYPYCFNPVNKNAPEGALATYSMQGLLFFCFRQKQHLFTVRWRDGLAVTHFIELPFQLVDQFINSGCTYLRVLRWRPDVRSVY